MRRAPIRSLFAGIALLVSSSVEAKAESFQPPGMWIWDNWFVHDGESWHAFYLALPKAVGTDRRWKSNDFYKHVGHAVSNDLREWRDVGPALCALSGTWNDRHIATASIVRHEDRWWMLFTGRGNDGDGVGLAVSEDLMTWEKHPEPLFPLLDTHGLEIRDPFQSEWEGKTREWAGISDPYVYPEKVDGWYHLILCARVLGVPVEESGCLARMRSKDLKTWEAAGIVAWPRCFERMETPQLWEREGKWYLTFGGVINEPWAKENSEYLPAMVRERRSHQNYCYAWSDFRKPGTAAEFHHFWSPGYIMKRIRHDDGREVALFTVEEKRGSCLSRPFPLHYTPNGRIVIEPPGY